MTKDLQKRVIFGGIALLFFIPTVMVGGVFFQIVIGLIAMLGVHELLKMKGLETATFEGALAMLAAFVLTLPIEDYLTYLPADGNMIAYGLVVLILMGTTVLAQQYNYEDVVYPIASSFYVGLGFHSLVDARIAGIDNKTVEGSLGGILSAVAVTVIFMMVDRSVAGGHGLIAMIFFTILFSIAGQFGDLVESAIKRHFGVKDSGKFIPGHGGVLDRFDSLIFVFPLMHFLGLF